MRLDLGFSKWVNRDPRRNAIIKFLIFCVCFLGIVSIIVEFAYSFQNENNFAQRITLLNIPILLPLIYCACRCFAEWGDYCNMQT